MSRESAMENVEEDLPLRVRIRERMQEGEKLYCVVDAARDRRLALAATYPLRLSNRTLFDGPLAARLLHVAPHLVSVEVASDYLAMWAEHLGRSAGILLITQADLRALWDHLRSIFVVTDPDDEECMFRFYDPRVLRTFLPTCTAAEGDEFFGPVRVILAEAQQPGALLSYQHDETGTTEEALLLGTHSASATQR